MQRFRRTAASCAAVGLLALGGVAATAVAASAGTIGSCSAQGDFADCVASGTANHPLTITVTVTSSPDESVTVFWDTTCSQGSGAGSSSGNFTATTPVTRVGNLLVFRGNFDLPAKEATALYGLGILKVFCRQT